MAGSEPPAGRGGTLPALLDVAVAVRPDATFLVTEEGGLSYGQFACRVAATAQALRALGVRRGDRVAAPAPNTAETVILLLGCARLGAALLPTNPRGTPGELAGMLVQGRPRLVVADLAAGDAAEVRQVGADAGLPVEDLRSLCSGADATTAPSDARPDDTALLIGTSGSTSAPKIVAHRHSSLVLTAQGFPFWLGLGSADRLLTPLPLFHSNALVYSVFGAIAAGASLVVLPRFSASRFWDQTREFGATQFNILGNIGEILARNPERRDDADNPVRVCSSGWAPPEPRHRAFEQRFGLDLVVGYGLSESPYGTSWPITGPKPFGTIGRLRQHPVLGQINSARVVDDDMRPVPPGAPGVLLLRNPATMQGYFGMPDATAEVLRDGWLNTGDIVSMDETGLVTFVGRSKDIIRRSGENFAPVEVEEVLDAHPGVLVSAVVAVPSPLSDDDAKAFVVRAAAADVTALELLDWCRSRLAQFKLPRYVEFVSELPLTHTNRVAKGKLPRERTPGEHDLEEHRRPRRPHQPARTS
ncbi:MAG TPA: AMP-binding protein [Pseudonocardia sp.]